MKIAALIVATALTLPVAAQEPVSQTTENSAAVQTLEGDTSTAQPICEPVMLPMRREDDATGDLDRIEVTGARVGEHYGRAWSDIEVWLTIALLVFTAGLVGMVVYLAKTAHRPWSPQSILRVLGVVLIVPLAVLLVVAGYSEKQIASVIGLLGVIVGYLLGNGDRSRGSG